MSRIHYRSGYKYQLEGGYSVRIPLRPPSTLRTEYVRLSPSGLLTLKDGYAWDGPSGPAIDTKDFMRGSLVHDALYQLMREGFLDRGFRPAADEILRDSCIEDGMSRIRAWWVYQGVRLFGGPCAEAAAERPIEAAP